MIRRTQAIAGAILVLLLAAGCGIGHARRTTVAELDARIRERIPAGTHHARVAAVLDSLEADRSAYDPNAREMRAIWRRTTGKAFTHGDIQARFRFDARGTMVGYAVKESFTGP